MCHTDLTCYMCISVVATAGRVHLQSADRYDLVIPRMSMCVLHSVVFERLHQTYGTCATDDFRNTNSRKHSKPRLKTWSFDNAYTLEAPLRSKF